MLFYLTAFSYPERLSQRIAAFDRMVDETEFEWDRVIYNECARALRWAREEFRKET